MRQRKTDEAFAEIRKAVAGSNTFARPAALTAWQIFDGDIKKIKAAIGDSTNTDAALVSILSTEKRFDEAVLIWNGLPAESRKAELKDVGDKLVGELIDAKQFRKAASIANDIKSGAATISSIRNGGFEVNEFNASAFDWHFTGGTVPQITLSSGVKRSGSYSLLVAFASTTEKNFRTISQTVAVEPGGPYNISFHYRANVETQSNLKWEVINAVDGSVLATVKLAKKTDDWAVVSSIFTVPLSADGVVLRLAVEDCGYAVCSTSGNLWFDDFQFDAK
ncbi:MAG: carbohydrate binding domain-containing protein [Blastocatellia bacterium]